MFESVYKLVGSLITEKKGLKVASFEQYPEITLKTKIIHNFLICGPITKFQKTGCLFLFLMFHKFRNFEIESQMSELWMISVLSVISGCC